MLCHDVVQTELAITHLWLLNFFRAFSTTSTYFVSKRRRYLLILLKLKVCVELFIYCYDWYGDGAGNTVEENYGVFFLIRMH